MTYDDARKTRKVPDFPVELSRLQEPAMAKDDPKVAEMREQYTCHYNRIYPLLKEGRIDFQQLADHTGFKERRIRETLLFRLTTGEVMQLFGKRDGFCYICNRRMKGLGNKEPLCLSCLHALDDTIQRMQPPASIEMPGRDAAETQIDAPDTLQQAEGSPESLDIQDDMVPRAQYEAVLSELSHYRDRYGPLTEAAIAMPDAEDAQPAEAPVRQPLPESASLFEILGLNEQDCAADVLAALHDFAEPLSQEPLRHFGFQRLKQRG